MTDTFEPINIEGVNFQISILNAAPDDGNNWVVVQPVVMRKNTDHEGTIDPSNVEPRGWSRQRDQNSPVAIAGGTNPDGLSESQAETARKVAYLVAQRFFKLAGNISAQRYTPGEAEPVVFDLESSQKVFVGAEKKNIPLAAISMLVQNYLTDISMHPKCLDELDMNGNTPGGHAARATSENLDQKMFKWGVGK